VIDCRLRRREIDQDVDGRQQCRNIREQLDAIRTRFRGSCLAAQPADKRDLWVICCEGGDLSAHPAPYAGNANPKRHGVAPRE
jgi:hypothetical protein